MQISPNKVVSLTYVLTISNGDTVDAATAEQPFVFIHGSGHTIAAFDKNLEGLKPGDKFDFSIESEDGYGEYSDDRKVHIPKNIFEVPGAPADLLEIGRTIPMQDNNGNPLFGVVLAVEGDKVLMDFNHPLAGQKLFFKGEILQVREATDEELAHGHVHGEGGVEH